MLADTQDRDGIFLQYQLPERKVWQSRLSVRPQFMLERAFDGTTNTYPSHQQPQLAQVMWFKTTPLVICLA